MPEMSLAIELPCLANLRLKSAWLTHHHTHTGSWVKMQIKRENIFKWRLFILCALRAVFNRVAINIVVVVAVVVVLFVVSVFVLVVLVYSLFLGRRAAFEAAAKSK